MGLLRPVASVWLRPLPRHGALRQPCIPWETEDAAKRQRRPESGSERAERDPSRAEGRSVRQRAGKRNRVHALTKMANAARGGWASSVSCASSLVQAPALSGPSPSGEGELRTTRVTPLPNWDACLLARTEGRFLKRREGHPAKPTGRALRRPPSRPAGRPAPHGATKWRPLSAGGAGPLAGGEGPPRGREGEEGAGAPARSPRPFVRGRRGPVAPGKGPRGASTSRWEFSPFPREGRVVRWEAVGLRSVRGRHCLSFPPAEPRVAMPPGCPATSLGVCAPTAALLFQRASARRTSVSPTAGCLRASAGATRSAPAGLRM